LLSLYTRNQKYCILLQSITWLGRNGRKVLNKINEYLFMSFLLLFYRMFSFKFTKLN
jgi:hypothetical protein